MAFLFQKHENIHQILHYINRTISKKVKPQSQYLNMGKAKELSKINVQFKILLHTKLQVIQGPYIK